MYTACEDHIEHVIDEFVTEFENSPDLSRIDENTAGSTCCRFCTRPAVYLLS